jgi:hypothetical protein
MFQHRIKNCSRLFSRPLSSKGCGRSARIIPSLNVKLNANTFIPEPSFNLLQVSIMNRALSTLVPQLSAKITPEIEQLLEITLEERSLEEEESTNGVRLAKCSHTSLEMFIRTIVCKYVDAENLKDLNDLHLKDKSLKFRILTDLEKLDSKFKFGNVDLANINTVADIYKVLNTKSKSFNPWDSVDSFKDLKWPLNVVFKENVQVREPHVSKIPLY